MQALKGRARAPGYRLPLLSMMFEDTTATKGIADQLLVQDVAEILLA